VVGGFGSVHICRDRPVVPKVGSDRQSRQARFGFSKKRSGRLVPIGVTCVALFFEWIYLLVVATDNEDSFSSAALGQHLVGASVTTITVGFIVFAVWRGRPRQT
jgi:hypothetical protein